MFKRIIFLLVLLTCERFVLAEVLEAPAEDMQFTLRSLNLIETPDYASSIDIKECDETPKFEKTQYEALQYEAFEDGRPLLEKRVVKESSDTGAIYPIAETLVISPESNLRETKVKIEEKITDVLKETGAIIPLSKSQ